MRQYRTIRAIMLDWAGTTVDHGSIAPVLALQELFARHGITLRSEDARRDMGLLKRDHINAILALPIVTSQWFANHGHEPSGEDVSMLFDEFGPLQMDIITQHSQLISGVKETVSEWQRRGIRIGTTTGYTRQMLTPVLAQAAKNGYRPDAVVCPDEVPAGRPAPWMLMRNAELLNVYPPSACVKIGDTVSDIEEGQNAGMWTIGLTRTGNMVGLNAADWEQLPQDEKSRRLREAEDTLRQAGAHFVAEDLAACEEILRRIEGLPAGEL
ncbi:phosphonoacetaldehyde hydrolase [Paracidobacterium acidisoli]|uniref:Phosphonoacetaldehyde hydrolase n=1 Tax=Paracidobacterium acidisoli TaxID=2303751 RepID=A0A372ILA0_9BACT|nr:phosphonoacetaldehyde hydrolase [Paracidobacterium acidisoli]MBT9332334.1 phosphonoacetaldehyde hydrolase [Paracidobacterium acidisoli]